MAQQKHSAGEPQMFLFGSIERSTMVNEAAKMLIFLFLLVSVPLITAFDFGVTKYDNLSNNQDTSKSKPIAEFVKKLDGLLINEKWHDIYIYSSNEVKSQIPEDQFTKMIIKLTGNVGGVERVKLKEIHLVESTGKSRVPIQNGKSIILPYPIQLNRPLAGTLSFVLCETKSKKGEYYYWLTYVLKKERKKWTLASFQTRLSRINGHKYDWYLERAGKFENSGQKRNALFYKMIGFKLLNPGDHIIVPEAIEGYNSCFTKKAPSHLPLTNIRDPEIWKTKIGEFTVTDVAPLMYPSMLSLQIRYLSRQEIVGNSVDEANRVAIFNYAKTKFPEYRDAFETICVVSVTQSKKAQIKCYDFKTN